MGKLYNQIFEKEFVTKTSILDEEYEKAKQELDSRTFNKHYEKFKPADSYHPIYYKLEIKEIEESEADLFLLYENLKEQRRIRKSTNIIKGILIAYSIATVIAAIIAVIIMLR